MSRAWRERPISTFFATGCGIGMIPFAPGTWGSAEGLAGALLLWGWGNGRGLTFVISYAIVCLVVFFAGVRTGALVEASSGDRDPGPVVIDEVVGQMIASAPVLLIEAAHPWWGLVLSFFLFRLFDIWKPGPINKLQDLPGGWGIMLDDVAAGILAGVLTYAAGRVF
jgi:phosphatidylglycerophosphatase A